MFVDNQVFARRLTEEAQLYDRILGVYSIAGSNERAAELYENFMSEGQFETLACMLESEAFLIQTMWRVHLLHPVTYQADCERWFGFLVVPHYKDMGPLLPTTSLENTTPTARAGGKFVSMDLASGMKRQLDFMFKISNLERFRDVRYCQKSVQRYKKFLKLISMRVGIVVPTLDIDLAWHTHMLQPEQYSQDTKNLIGYSPDHDDDMPSQRLELRREKTQLLWNRTFKDDSYYQKNDEKGIWQIEHMAWLGLTLSGLIVYCFKFGNEIGGGQLPTLAQGSPDPFWIILLALLVLVVLFRIIMCLRKKRVLGGQWKVYTVDIRSPPTMTNGCFPITFEKDNLNRFKVASLTIKRSEYISTGGDILSNDTIGRINGVSLNERRPCILFNNECGFTFKNLKVVTVIAGLAAEQNWVYEGWIIQEFNKQMVKSDEHLISLVHNARAQNAAYAITFFVPFHVPKALETFVDRMKRLHYPLSIEFRRWVPKARESSEYYSSCGVAACGAGPSWGYVGGSSHPGGNCGGTCGGVTGCGGGACGGGGGGCGGGGCGGCGGGGCAA